MNTANPKNDTNTYLQSIKRPCLSIWERTRWEKNWTSTYCFPKKKQSLLAKPSSKSRRDKKGICWTFTSNSSESSTARVPSHGDTWLDAKPRGRLWWTE